MPTPGPYWVPLGIPGPSLGPTGFAPAYVNYINYAKRWNTPLAIAPQSSPPAFITTTLALAPETIGAARLERETAGRGPRL